MITRVRKYIRDNRMLKAEDMVVAGVSGGADSIAMLPILKSLQKEIGFSMEVVHVHHGIRGQEADRDEQFVEKICRDWGIPFRSRHYPVPELSGKWKLGEEETGRIVRKQAFQEEKKRLGFSGEQSKKNGQFRVALAHNRNDLARPRQQVIVIGEPVPDKRTTKNLAICSLVLGILAIVFSFLPYIGIILALIALPQGIVSLVQKRPGKGLAIAGIITGIFGILLSILFILVYVVAVLAL